MSAPTEQSDLQSLQSKIARLEQQVIDQQSTIGQQENFISNQQQTLKDHQRVISDQKDTIKNRDSLIYNKEVQLQKLISQLSQLQTMQFGASSERYIPGINIDQMKFDFFNEAELLAKLSEVLERRETTVKTHKRKGRQSKPLPDHLPVVEVEHEPEDCQCDVCGAAMKRIGEEITQQLAIIPMVFYIIRHIRPKMGCPGKCGVKTAKLPEQPLPRTQASPVLLAWLMVSKYLDGLPLYRLEKIAKRAGVELQRNKTARWLVDIGLKLMVFNELFTETLISYDLAWADETGFQVLKEPKRAPQLKSWFWVRRGGPPDKPVVLLDYSSSRSGDVAKKLFDGFKGYLVCDAYSGYLPLSDPDGAILVYCNDHARRRFKDVVKSVGKDHAADEIIAARALLWYQCLYDIEDEIKDLSAQGKYDIRQNKAVSLWEQFIAWASRLMDEGVQHQPTRSALKYLLNHQVELQRYCDDGRLPISNIKAEHTVKTIAIPRKNFLFSDTKDGAKSSALIYSVIETARANGHDPHKYLTVLLTELPAAKTKAQIEALLPWNLTPEQVVEKFNTYPAP